MEQGSCEGIDDEVRRLFAGLPDEHKKDIILCAQYLLEENSPSQRTDFASAPPTT
jgi:hypothetical protein